MSSGTSTPSLSPSPNFSSFPPLFRSCMYKSDPSTISDSNYNDTEHEDPDQLPLIDMENLELEKLEGACKGFGMFRLVNHGIPVNLLNQLHDHAKRLFNLSFESKQALFTSNSNGGGGHGGTGGGSGSSSSTGITYFWGNPALTPSGSVLEGSQNDVNWFEALNVPLVQLQLMQTQDPLLICFRNLLEEYGRHMTRLAGTLFEAMIATGDLVVDQARRKGYLDIVGPHMRIYRYPNISSIADQLKGLDAHTDSSVLTILNEDAVGGLQLFKDDSWHNVKPLPATLVVNLGDIIQVISNDKYKSATHRVKLNKHKERISIGYFVFPKDHFMISSSKYRPFTYADYRAQNQEDITKIGWKIGLMRFKLPDQVI